jgi:hypothetical protein
MSKQQRREQTNSVVAAERTLATLQAKRAAVVVHADDLAAERAAIAYATHAIGDGKSRARLDVIHQESASVTGELQSLDAAIAEADKRLSAAREHEAKAADKAAAQELLKELTRFRAIGTQLDAALAAVATNGAELHASLGKIHALGSQFPTSQQLDSLGTRCLLTAIAATPFRRNFETIAPRERRSFSDLIATWATTIEGRIAQRADADAA